MSGWRKITDRPEAAMGVLLYIPGERHPECAHGEDYGFSLGHFDGESHPDIFSGWFEQGTNHDFFEQYRIDVGCTPTHWMPLLPPPEAA